MTDADHILMSIREELINISDPLLTEKIKRFFKEEIRTYGVKNPAVREISKKYLPLLRKETKEFVFELCDKLWESGYIEESLVACDYSYSLRKKYTRADFEIFERWVKNNITNWASCDTFCNHTVGDFVMMYPEFLVRLSDWTKSRNRWVRRASAVSLIIPARKGIFHDHIFETADKLLNDEDDMVRKGYGWMLKEASKADMDRVFRFVMERKNTMPRTSLRYAIEKLPSGLKAEAMKK